VSTAGEHAGARGASLTRILKQNVDIQVFWGDPKVISDTKSVIAIPGEFSGHWKWWTAELQSGIGFVYRSWGKTSVRVELLMAEQPMRRTRFESCMHNLVTAPSCALAIAVVQ
jgi:hypothetical protein